VHSTRGRCASTHTRKRASLLSSHLGKDPRSDLDLIRGRSENPLQGSSPVRSDLDKIEYLKRDAFMCASLRRDRCRSLTIRSYWSTIRKPARRALACREKALSALESLLFAKYQMYRNVYWHHAVRSATAMYKRLVGRRGQGEGCGR